MPRKRGERKQKNVSNGTASVASPKHERNADSSMNSGIERSSVVLWRRPFLTIRFFLLETCFLIYEYTLKLLLHLWFVLVLLSMVATIYVAYRLPGPHQSVIYYVQKKVFWCLYWTGLGVLSSIGLGTGLHTFLLYLGPHIASVTLAAYECASLMFPEPPYPDQIICPYNSSSIIPNGNGNGELPISTDLSLTGISLWAIMSKVRLEAFMWGAGTALGELPPYFMARAARLSGQEPDDEEYREFEELIRHRSIVEQQSWLDKAKFAVEKAVERIGFLGILLCASIPNPLFDLAGITCGHFLVPFWTFFGATLIGKAIIKMHIQKLFVIVTFSEHHVEQLIQLFKYVPVFGVSLQQPFKDYLKQQKLKLHRKPGDDLVIGQSSWLKDIFEYFVMAMIGYFLISIVNSLAQSYHKRLCQTKRKVQDPTVTPCELAAANDERRVKRTRKKEYFY